MGVWRGLAAAFAMTLSTVAAMAAPQDAVETLCGPFVDLRLELAPILHARVNGSMTDEAFGCLMWQSFIYLNWPALAKSPGEPDPSAHLGGPGPTVWETYKRHDEVFLPNAAAPAPWGVPDRSLGGPRHLTATHQTDGDILVDRAGRPVYYEMLIDRDEYAYIVAHKLYDAEAQRAFAASEGIALPAGPTREYGPIGTIELKAAWKVLTPAEVAAKPRRFYTATAVLDDGSTVVVGLVGLHINQRIAGFTQGVWASFLQIDSAPLSGAPPPSRDYSFYNPDCARCIVNTATLPPRSTQVEQIFPVAPSVRAINAFARSLIRDADPGSPWQFYELLGVQWPQFTLGLPTPVPDPRRQAPRGVPLAIGTPSTETLMNPVIETFRQTANVSCLGCHAASATALSTAAGPLAADYSFLLAHAQRAARRN